MANLFVSAMFLIGCLATGLGIGHLLCLIFLEPYFERRRKRWAREAEFMVRQARGDFEPGAMFVTDSPSIQPRWFKPYADYHSDSDGSGEADKTGTGLAVGDSAGPKDIAR